MIYNYTLKLTKLRENTLKKKKNTKNKSFSFEVSAVTELCARKELSIDDNPKKR